MAIPTTVDSSRQARTFLTSDFFNGATPKRTLSISGGVLDVPLDHKEVLVQGVAGAGVQGEVVV